MYYQVACNVLVEAPDGYSRAVEKFVHELIQESLPGESSVNRKIEVAGASAVSICVLGDYLDE